MFDVTDDVHLNAGANLYNYGGARITAGGLAEFEASTTIFDYGVLEASSIDFTAGRVDTRRDGNYTLEGVINTGSYYCLLYTSPSPRDQRGSRMPSSA